MNGQLSTKSIHLRRFAESDIPFMRELYASVRMPELALTGLSDNDKNQFLALQFAAQHQHYMNHYNSGAFNIIEVNGVTAGRFFVDYWDTEIRVVDIALLPPFRGKGIGSYLFSCIFAKAAAKNLPVTIHVERNNPALRLYRRLGFVISAERDDVYLLMEWVP